MRFKALILVSAFAATAMPAFAQDYGRACQRAQGDSQIGGMIVGTIIGGVLGSQVAASGHRSDGSAVGAVLGGLVGSGVGKDSVNCGQPRYPSGSSYNPNPNYGGPNYNDYGYSPYGTQPAYGQDPYQGSPYGYAPAPVNTYPADPGAYSPPRYADDGWYRQDSPPRGRHRDDLDGRGDRAYKRNDDYGDEDCTDAVQITKLPDGTEVHRPIEVCRDTYYGDWKIRD